VCGRTRPHIKQTYFRDKLSPTYASAILTFYSHATHASWSDNAINGKFIHFGGHIKLYIYRFSLKWQCVTFTFSFSYSLLYEAKREHMFRLGPRGTGANCFPVRTRNANSKYELKFELGASRRNIQEGPKWQLNMSFGLAHWPRGENI